MSALVFEAAPAADTLWVGRTLVSVSRLGRLGLVVRADIVQVTGADVTWFRFRDAWLSGATAGTDRSSGLKLAWKAARSSLSRGLSSWQQLRARSDARHSTRPIVLSWKRR